MTAPYNDKVAPVTLFKFEDFIVEPIPLTEEWLVKFGFKRSSTPNQLTLGRFSYELSYSDLYYGLSRMGKCKYLHQLQNLYFALTQEELEIQQ